MSTYWGYRCISHEPALQSDYWHNHGQDELLELLKNREHLINLPIDNWGNESPERYWLREHPYCKVVISNEYGKTLDEYNAERSDLSTKAEKGDKKMEDQKEFTYEQAITELSDFFKNIDFTYNPDFQETGRAAQKIADRMAAYAISKVKDSQKNAEIGQTAKKLFSLLKEGKE